jgi:hypothetical protein
VEAIGIDGIYLFGMLLILPVLAFFAGFGLERRLSQQRGYRILRWLVRLVAARSIVAILLIADPQMAPEEAGGILVAAVLGLFLVRLLDIALDVGPPRVKRDRPQTRLGELMVGLKWNKAVIYGGIGGMVGFLIGGILFGVLTWSALIVLILGVKLLFRGVPAGCARGFRDCRRGQARPPRRARPHLLGRRCSRTLCACGVPRSS